MIIRKTEFCDLPRVLEIYARAREFMAEHGNPNQWGPTNWPPEALLRKDISEGKSYVCVEHGIEGVFYFDFGERVEPTYCRIEGEWKGSETYGVVHRIASAGTRRGVGKFCIDWAFARCGHLRIDTHTENLVMQRLLETMGFVRCGIIHVEQDPYPRIAYEKGNTEEPIGE